MLASLASLLSTTGENSEMTPLPGNSNHQDSGVSNSYRHDFVDNFMLDFLAHAIFGVLMQLQP